MSTIPSEIISAAPLGKQKRSQFGRFWDRYMFEQLKTTNGFLAQFSPTVGGTATAWQGKKVKISAEIGYADHSVESHDLGVAILEKVSTSRNKDVATLTLKSLADPMMQADAEKIKDGGSWYENTPLSFIINELLQSVYKDHDGSLPPEMYISNNDLGVFSITGEKQVWNLGVPPNWDGTTFTPSPLSHPVTAMATNSDRTEVYVGLGGLDGANPAELWKYEPQLDLWTLLGKADPAGGLWPIQEIVLNTSEDVAEDIFGVMWKDVGTDVASMELPANKGKWFAPDAKIFWWTSTGEDIGDYLDDSNHSLDVDDFFPGKWDVREMFAQTQETTMGRYNRTTDFEAAAPPDIYKQCAGAHLGHLQSHVNRVVPMPIGRDHYHEDDAHWPLLDSASSNLVLVGSDWTGASGTTPPNGWSVINPGNAPTFTVTAGKLRMTNNGAGAIHQGIITISIPIPAELKKDFDRKFTAATVYEGLKSCCPMYLQVVDLTCSATLARITAGFSAYSGSPVGYNFYIDSYLNDSDSPYNFYRHFNPLIEGWAYDVYPNIVITLKAPTGDGAYIEIDELILKAAYLLDNAEALEESAVARQAGESIPLTGYSKVLIGSFGARLTQTSGSFPGIGWPGDGLIKSNALDLGSESWLEATIIAQDPTAYNVDWTGTPFSNPLYGKFGSGESLPPDNIYREQVSNVNGGSNASSFHKASIVDTAAMFDITNLTEPGDSIGSQHRNHADADIRAAREGHGWMGIGINRVGGFTGTGLKTTGLATDIWTTTQGIVRWTNGQQGLFALVPGSNSGKGGIVFFTSTGPKPANPNVAVFTGGEDFLFNYGTTEAGWSEYRFKTRLKYFNCDTKVLTEVTGGDWEMNSVSNIAPFNVSSTLYPTAGCGYGTKLYLATQTAPTISALYDGTNPEGVRTITYLWVLNFTTGITATPVPLYNSEADASIFACDGFDSGNYPEAGDTVSPVNNTRKICWLHYNPEQTSPLSGWAFRKDSVLSTRAAGAAATPCHEVFKIDPDVGTNKLTIIDHDAQDGVNYDCAGFVGFCNGDDGKTWYFRQRRSTPDQPVLGSLGRGLTLCYHYEDGATHMGGKFWDGSLAGYANGLYLAEGYLGHQAAVVVTESDGSESIVGSFDHYGRQDQVLAADLPSGSTQIFFKIGTKATDGRVDLADFTGMKVWDAISDLCKANNYLFGFNKEKFFIASRSEIDASEPTMISSLDRQIHDLVKEVDLDIRNVITATPYRPQMEATDWEITHVSGDMEDPDTPGETIDKLNNPYNYNGELLVGAASHREASINLICSRAGRLSAGDLDDAIWSSNRNPVMFRWLTHSPMINVTNMVDIGSSDTLIYLNTVFEASLNGINVGDIMIFVNPTTSEQFGRIITAINTILNTVTLESGPGFTVSAFTALTITSASVGADNSGYPNYVSNVTDIGKRYTDEGVAVITAIASSANGTVLTLNNINPFKNVTILASANANAPNFLLYIGDEVPPLPNYATYSTNGDQTDYQAAYVMAVDRDAKTVTLGTAAYPISFDGFQVGQVINLAYILAPKAVDDTANDPPFFGIIQDLPDGLGNIHWAADPQTDAFNLGDIIRVKFKGLLLTKDAASPYTVIDTVSIAKWGEQEWKIPDNRFISYELAEYWPRYFLSDYSQPKMNLIVTTDFLPTFSFLNAGEDAMGEVHIQDPLMLAGMGNFTATGYTQQFSYNLKKAEMTIQIRTSEDY